MRLLLDTHIFLWCVMDEPGLSKAARLKISSATEVYVSSASIWEAVIKSKLGKLTVNLDDLVGAIEESGFIELPITSRHAMKVYQLADVHREPFDRILVAQAMCEPLRFLTADTKLKDYSELIDIV